MRSMNSPRKKIDAKAISTRATLATQERGDVAVEDGGEAEAEAGDPHHHHRPDRRRGPGRSGAGRGLRARFTLGTKLR